MANIPRVPSYINANNLQNPLSTLTTPQSNGNILTAPDQCNWDSHAALVMSPPSKSPLEPGSNQMWHYDPAGYGNIWLTHPGECAVNSPKDASYYYIGSNENMYDLLYNEGAWSHIHSGEGNVPIWVCANDKRPYASVNACPWITLQDAYSCCLLEPKQAESQFYGQCSPSYLPAGDGNVCPKMMAQFCQNYWAADKNTKKVCEENYFNTAWFQANPQDVGQAVHEIVVNYIMDQSPQSYVQKRDGIPGGSGSNYTFFSEVLPNLASITNPAIAGSTGPGVLDPVLKYYCRNFTRDDLLQDPTLQEICGCHLLTQGENPDDVPVPENLAKQKMNIPTTRDVGNQYPYSTVSCDPVCNFSAVIQNYAHDQCKETECIIDNVNINQINSQGDVNIGLACGGCPQGQCNCYISNVTVNEIHSSGGVTIDQKCGACFTFANNDISTAQKVDCSSFAGGSNVYKKWSKYLVIGGGVAVAAIIIAIVLALIF